MVERTPAPGKHAPPPERTPPPEPDPKGKCWGCGKSVDIYRDVPMDGYRYSCPKCGRHCFAPERNLLIGIARIDKIEVPVELLDGDFPFDIKSKSASQIAALIEETRFERKPSANWPPPPKRKRFKKYAHQKLPLGVLSYTYKIVELGVKDSDPFPRLRIPIDPKLVADALNEAYFQGYKGMAETLHEITKGVTDG